MKVTMIFSVAIAALRVIPVGKLEAEGYGKYLGLLDPTPPRP